MILETCPRLATTGDGHPDPGGNALTSLVVFFSAVSLDNSEFRV